MQVRGKAADLLLLIWTWSTSSFYFNFLLFYVEWEKVVKTGTDTADVGARIHILEAEDTRTESATWEQLLFFLSLAQLEFNNGEKNWHKNQAGTRPSCCLSFPWVPKPLSFVWKSPFQFDFIQVTHLGREFFSQMLDQNEHFAHKKFCSDESA